MSNWSSTAYSGGTVNIATLISELENEICVPFSFPNTSTIASTASGSFSSRLSTARTLQNDEIAVFWTVMSVSAASAGTDVESTHVINGSVIPGTIQRYTEHTDGADTNGLSGSVINISYVQNLSGSGIVFDLQWRKPAGPGTIYSRYANGILLVFKKRA